MSPRTLFHAWPVLSLLALMCGDSCAAEPLIPAARRTETVQLIERSLPAVVTLFGEARGPDGQREVRFGSGTIIHPRGFVLTNDHVVSNLQQVAATLSDGTTLRVRLVARFSHEDLAVLQLDSSGPLPTLPLGRSHDLLLGEPALVIGTPGGLVQSVSTGLVSGINRSTRNEQNFLPWMIQTSAAVSRGNSGGPLINAVGEQIGVLATSRGELQNVSFAIAIDHVRRVLPQMLAVEERGDFWFGAECDPLVDPAVVSHVREHSPAAVAGLQSGDQVRQIGDVVLTSGVQLPLALVGRKAGDILPVQVVRDERALSLSVTLGRLPLAEPAVVDGLQPGVRFALYRGEWSQLPDFDSLTPVKTGRTAIIDLSPVDGPSDHFGLRFEGYVQIPRDGVYAFYTGSDDGSRLWIGGRLVVDNDGNHPARQTAGLIRLRGGLHPLRVDYYEDRGAEFLEVAWEGPGVPKSRLPAEVQFAPPDTATPTDRL